MLMSRCCTVMAVAELDAEQMLTLEQLEQRDSDVELDALLQPVDCLLSALPQQRIDRQQAQGIDLLHGQPVANHTT